MKILHVITSLRTGGAEHLLVDLLPRFKKDGHEVSILLFDGTRTPFYNELEKLGIPIYSIGAGESSMHNPFLVFKLRKYLKQYDIVHTHNTPCQLLTAAAACTLSHPAKLITTEHSTTNNRRAWKWYRPIDRWMYNSYEKIICVSKDAENNLLSALADKNLATKICTIPNGVDVLRFKNAIPHQELSTQYSHQILIMMVAAFRKGKDQKTLIRTMKHLPSNYHLFLVGDGECRPECEELTRSLGLETSVTFLGIRTDISSLLKASHYNILSSEFEGLSLSSIEGMAAGKPFLASDVDGLRDIVGGAGVLFPCGNSEALANEIIKLQEDSTWSKQIAEQCQQRAMQYDISKMANSYLQIYHDIIQ